MVPAVEVLLCTPAVRNIIRESRTFEIPNVIDTNRQLGMVSLDNSIAELYFNGLISKEDAIRFADSANDVRLQIKMHDRGELGSGEELGLSFDEYENETHIRT